MILGQSRQFILRNISGPAAVFRQNARTLSSASSVKELVDQHELVKSSKPLLNKTPLNRNAVYTNSELRLSDVDVVGFDYDYTLAPYTQKLDHTIFKMILQRLVDTRHYPSALSDLQYDAGFLARGAHYDMNTGIFMKVDSYHRIQTETVHECFRKMTSQEISERFPGRRLFLGRSEESPRYKQIVDIFELPQLYAWCAVLDYLKKLQTSTHPYIVFEDIKNVTYDLHVQGALHGHIMQNIGEYLEPSPKLVGMLETLREQNKKLFILTNSPYKFVNVGMSQMIGENWKEHFDIIICLSKKPKFFEDRYRPFRRLSSDGTPTFGEVTELNKGGIYCEGNVADLHEMTGWKPDRILYFGDQMYADLAEPVLNQGWHTGAIIRELDEEVSLLNSADYQALMFSLGELNYLINEMQLFLPDPEAVQYTDKWCTERKQVRSALRDLHPTKFGSIFRTHLTPTLFYRRLSRFAEIYTSDLTNLAQYNTSHHRFTPIRQDLPHELHCVSQFDIYFTCPLQSYCTKHLSF